MKTSRFLFIVFISILLSGCVKETLMLVTLKGKWVLDSDKTLVTTTEDVSFLDLYSRQWTGTVTVNGVAQNYSQGIVTTFMDTYFYITPEIQLFWYPPTPKIRYKGKIFDSSIDWDVIATGNINKELTITDNNNTINIKIDLKAPIKNLTKGVEYDIDDPRWENDLRIIDLEFLSPTRVSGSIVCGDIISCFNGRWNSDFSEITFKMGTDFSDTKQIQSHKYYYNSHELVLYKYIGFSKINYSGRIPYEKFPRLNR
jgi:hypothetical protein